jgi:hypothetical protein
MVTLAVGDEGFEDEGADQRLWQPGGNHPKSGGFPVTMDNVRYDSVRELEKAAQNRAALS